MQKQPPIMLEPQKIAAAFEIIKNSSNTKELIKEADTYIRQCESNPELALVLMRMFEQANDHSQKWQILIHLSNVIKRNWTTKRRPSQVSLSEQTKNKIKNGILGLYETHWSAFYKEFNQIFKFLARFQFPSNYPALKSFIIQILSSLSNASIQSFMTLKELLPYLSLIKTVFKESSIRKLSHTRDLYLEHIVQPVNLSFQIFQRINSALGMLKQAQAEGAMNIQLSNRLLECSRKIDKIILYCLQSMVGTMQTDAQIVHIVQKLIDKLEFLISLRTKQLNQQIQLNIYGILQGVAKLQASFPFIFTSFLQKYLKTILHLLISQKFRNQNLINCILTSNTKPLITFSYYSSELQFKQSMECRKGSSNSYINEQNICHTVFMSIYGGNNATAFMEKAIVDLMPKYKNTDNQIADVNFEEGDHHENASEYGSFELLLILLKNLMLRFKQQFKPFVSKILDHLLENNSATSSEAVANMYEIILLITKVYDEGNLPMERIFNLMQVCYSNGNFAMFSRLIRYYNYYFNFSTIRKSFEILVNVMATPKVDHQILFQCAVCIKRILNQHEEEGLPVDQLGLCLVNLLNLVSIYKGVPSHLWNLLQLINEILKLINSEAVFINLEYMIESLNNLVQSNNNDELVVNGISYLLQSVLELVSIDLTSESSSRANKNQLLEQLYEISISLVGRNIYNTKMESPSVLYKLWLSVARCVHISQVSSQLHAKMVNALDTLKNKIYEEDPVIYLQLIQEYILAGFISLPPQKLLDLYDEIMDLIEHDRRDRALMAFYSLYLTYFVLTNNYIPKLIIRAVEELRRMIDKISQQTNILRTFLMLVINHHLIEIGPQKIFEMLNTAHQNDYRSWFWPYVWSLQYLNHKYACKVASIAMISSVDILQDANILLPDIEGHVPLQKIMKAASFQVEPVNSIYAATSYVNSFKMIMQSNEKTNRKIGATNSKCILRKFKTQIKQEWAECDLSKNFQQSFSRILNKIGWNIETIQQRFDKIASLRIIGLLMINKGQSQQV